MTLRPAGSVPSVVSAVAAQQGGSLTVGTYLPSRHTAFVRVLNPVRAESGSPRSWASVTKKALSVDATTKWNDAGDHSPHEQPETGSIDPEVARALARILRPHTTTPTECFFLAWEGYAGLRDDLRRAARIDLEPDRSMLILSGDLNDGAESFEEPPFIRSPQWWLPRDGAWAVGNDIYAASVYVAGTEEAISALLEAEDIEAYRAAPHRRIIAEEFERRDQ